MCAWVEIQRVPSRDRAYPGKQRRTTHSPERQETSATPGSALQSWPIGEKGVRGSTHPPPEIKNFNKKIKKLCVLRATARPGTLTTLKIACSIDALPGPSAPSKHAAGRPAGALLCARTAADPAPLDGGNNGGARAGSDAFAIADHVGCGAATRGWVQRGRGRVAVRASESARISVDARWLTVNGVLAVRRRIAYDLK